MFRTCWYLPVSAVFVVATVFWHNNDNNITPVIIQISNNCSITITESNITKKTITREFSDKPHRIIINKNVDPPLAVSSGMLITVPSNFVHSDNTNIAASFSPLSLLKHFVLLSKLPPCSVHLSVYHILVFFFLPFLFLTIRIYC